LHGYIHRLAEFDLGRALGRSPAVVILGPRQCGKSTLAREYLKGSESVYLDLQSRIDRHMLAEPELFLERHRQELVCLDEIRLLPEFFAVLRSEIDHDRRPGRFLILGSASRDLIRQSSESLAGRIAHLSLTPFLLSEVGRVVDWQTLWVRGGFPDSLLAGDEEDSFAWRQDFMQTFLERDIPALGLTIPMPVMMRLWRLLAHYHGQTVNYSKLAGAMDLSVLTLKKYLAVLEQTYMIRLLPPCEANLKKRLTRSPKVYIRDSGILHALLEIEDYDHLLGHPVAGASWEGFALEHITAALPRWRPSFVRTSNGAEIDLVMERGARKVVFEFKFSKAPRPSRGFFELVDNLQAEKAWIIAPVDEVYEYREGVGIANLAFVQDLESSM
jgi:predicted AAA+ superfamily ATPase